MNTMMNTTEPQVEVRHDSANKPARSSQLLRALAIALSVLALTGTLTTATASAAFQSNADGQFRAADGSTAQVTASCMGRDSQGLNRATLNLSNSGFRRIQYHFLQNGQWYSANPRAISDQNSYEDPQEVPFTGSVALFVHVQDQSGEWHGEWVPFFSGRNTWQSGYWCTPSGAG